MDTIKPKKVKTALSVGKLSLSTFNPLTKGFAKLKFDLWQNNPRIIVDTGDQNLRTPENNYGRIEGALASADLYAVLELIESAVKSKEEVKWKAACFKHEWANNQKQKDPSHVSSVWVGRDGEGCVYISVVSEVKKEFPILKFVFGPPDQRYTKWFNANGEPFTKAQTSQLYAKAFVRMLSPLMANILVTHFEEVMPPQFSGNRQGGGGGGGFNRGGGGGGGYGNRGGGGGSRPEPETAIAVDAGGEDDLPF